MMAAIRSLEELGAWLAASEAYTILKISDDGRRLVGVRQTITGWSICAGLDENGCRDVYSYTFLTTAVLAFREWSGDPGTDPLAWHRHQPSNRRRPDGDPTREFIEP